jgi:hypothetical protein
MAYAPLNGGSSKYHDIRNSIIIAQGLRSCSTRGTVCVREIVDGKTINGLYRAIIKYEKL